MIDTMVIGQLTRLNFNYDSNRACSHRYTLVVNGKLLEFNSEEDLITQDKFRVECMRKLSVLPAKFSNVEWLEIVNNALSIMVVQEN